MKKKIVSLKFWENPKGKKITNTSKGELTYNGKKIPMIRFIDNKIHEIRDLSIFKKYRYNREETQGGFKQLLDSVVNQGWILPYIIVNENMEVLYGQHTLDVAREINGSVYYMISENQTVSQLVAKENVKRWNVTEALKAYASDPKNKEAKNILKIYEDICVSLKKNTKEFKKITIPQLVAILYKDARFIGGIRNNGGFGMLGNLSPWKNENYLKTVRIISYAQKKSMPKGISRHPALTGLLKFIFDNEDTLDFDRLLNKFVKFEFHNDDNDGYYKQVENLYN